MSVTSVGGARSAGRRTRGDDGFIETTAYLWALPIIVIPMLALVFVVMWVNNTQQAMFQLARNTVRGYVLAPASGGKVGAEAAGRTAWHLSGCATFNLDCAPGVGLRDIHDRVDCTEPTLANGGLDNATYGPGGTVIVELTCEVMHDLPVFGTFTRTVTGRAVGVLETNRVYAP